MEQPAAPQAVSDTETGERILNPFSKFGMGGSFTAGVDKDFSANVEVVTQGEAEQIMLTDGPPVGTGTDGQHVKFAEGATPVEAVISPEHPAAKNEGSATVTDLFGKTPESDADAATTPAPAE